MAIRFPLTTGRLVIRPFAPADREPMARIYEDPAVMRFIDTRGEDPSTWIDGYVRHQAAYGYACWAVLELETRALIGEAGLAPFDGHGPQLELGYLLRRDRWGRGLGTEAARACTAAAFAGLGARELFAVVDAGNDASLAVLRKAGFRRAGERLRRGRRQHLLRAVAPPPTAEPVRAVSS